MTFSYSFAIFKVKTLFLICRKKAALYQDYLIKYKHLPGVPSANEIYKEGLNLGEMDVILLKKIEELTLYIIKQQKEITYLKELIDK